MNIKKLKVLSWNTRGLGNPEKCEVVRNTIRSARCDFCCLQETKWGSYNISNHNRTLPSFFDRDCVTLNVIGNSGGCIIAWKRCFSMTNCWTMRHSVSAVLTHNSTGSTFVISTVYGPTADDLKETFLDKLRSLSQLVNYP